MRVTRTNNIVYAIICMVRGLLVSEYHDGTVRTVSAELALTKQIGRVPDSIVEGEAKRLVGFFVALGAFKECFLEILEDRIQCAARRVDCCVLAVRARNAARDCTCERAKNIVTPKLPQRNTPSAGTTCHSRVASP